MRRVVFALLACILPFTTLRADQNWPQFRGPSAGVADDKALPDEWSTTKNVVWKTDVPGRGWSSPVVWGDRIILTTVVNDGESEAPKKGLYFGGDRPKPSAAMHHWLVLCLDWKTGKPLWQREVHKGPPASPIHVKNSYASETPITNGERVYAYFGNLGLFCFDLDGKELWSKKWGSAKMRLGWGTAASPVLHKDRIYVVNDNDEKSFLVALDAKTGQEIWRIERDEKSNWATPFVWENEQRTELVTSGTNRVRSYDLEGKLIWELGGMSTIAIPTPFARHGLLYVSSGYVMDKKKPIFAIRPGASGDISLKPEETSNQGIAWSQKMAGPYNPTPLVYGDQLYVLYDMGFLACFDAHTGKPLYDKQRLGSTAGFTVSPWACAGKVYCLNEDGETFVVQAGPEFKLLGTSNLDEMCMATPAVVRGDLLIRTLTKLYRIGKGTATGAIPPQKSSRGAEIRVGIDDGDFRGADQRALQAAVDYVAGLGGGTVHVGPGRYTLRNAVMLRDHVNLVGVPGKTVLAACEGLRCKLTADGDCNERQVTLAEPAGFRVGDGISVADKEAGSGFAVTTATLTAQVDEATFRISKPLYFDYMVDKNATARLAFPLVSGDNIKNAVVEGLTLEGRGAKSEKLDGCRGGGVFLFECQNVAIRNCTVRAYNGDGISFQVSRDITVEDCLCENNLGLGLHPGSGSQHPVLRRNRSVGNGGDGLFVCWRVKHGLFEDNELRDNKGAGVSIGHKDTDNLFRGNTITGNLSTGVLFRNESEAMGAHRNVFEKNRIVDNGTPSGKEPMQPNIVIRGCHHDVVFRDNIIGYSRPASLDVAVRSGPQVKRLQADDNRFENVKVSVKIEAK